VAAALTCDLCKEEVICSALKSVYDKLLKWGEQNCHWFWVVYIGAMPCSMRHQEFNKFEEFKAYHESIVKDIWDMIDSDKNGELSEILDKPEVKIGSSFLLQLATYLFEKLDIDYDDEITAFDTPMFSDMDEEDVIKSIKGKLITLPSPLYAIYAQLDQDRNYALSLEEFTNFLKKIFALIDKNEDCFIDMNEIIAVLDQNKLPKDLQLGVKQILQNGLLVANHIFNRVFEVADSNQDNVTTVDEILKFSDFNIIESEFTDLVYLGAPGSQNLDFLVYDHSSRRSRMDRWLEVLENFTSNPAFKSSISDFKCE